METLARVWPAFLAVGAAQAMFSRRVHRRAPPALVWPLAGLAASVAGWLALWLLSERMVERLNDMYGATSASSWGRLLVPVTIAAPTLWTFVLGQVALPVFPRSHPVVPVATVVAGVALSWAIGIWLMMTAMPPWMLRLSEIPGALGGIASALGFVASTALSMVTHRVARGNGR